MILQPCDWIEYDHNFKYVVDAYGRTQAGDIARVRITGFKPYFYLRALKGETAAQVASGLSNINTDKGIRVMKSIRITEEFKLDAMNGFNGLVPIRVWKIACGALWEFKLLAKGMFTIGKREIKTEDIFESNLPPYLRLFHERELSPASAFSFDEKEDTLDGRIDVCYTTDYSTLNPDKTNIPLYVLSYDIETYSQSGNFPVSSNLSDEIIQIGLSFRWSDTLLDSTERYVLVSGTCEPSNDPSIKFISCTNEKDLLLKFQEIITIENPDIIAGYNTFGFDDGYIADRCQIHKIELQLGRTDTRQWGTRMDFVKTEKKTFELASGKYAVRYFDMPGRLPIDLLLSIRREQNLDSYKLDNVSSTFLRDKVLKLDRIMNENTYMYEIKTKSTRGLFVGNMIRFDVVTNTINPYREGEKFTVTSVTSKSFVIQSLVPILNDLSDQEIIKLEWSFSKDDISAQQMFKNHLKGPSERSIIAKYCIQDCDLVLTLMAKLDTLVNARGMADVCKVPIDFIFLRGQGIKIYSAVAYNASKRNQIIMAQESVEGDMSYEGAVVLPPKIGMYLEDPVVVLDYNSLYPSNMIAFNISPDTLVYVKTYDLNGKKLVPHEGATDEEIIELKKKYTIDEISFDVKKDKNEIPSDLKKDKNEIPSDLKNDNDEIIGRKTCGFAQPTDDLTSIGLLPMTLDTLLKKRKETRKLIEQTEDDAQKSVLNGLQLAYKVVANSVYGQTGSRTSPIRRVEVAACTTAAGRERLMFAKNIVETEFGGKVIYGDTDSIFVTFAGKDLSTCMETGKKVAGRITSLCRKAHKIEYEKTFFPFILFCRKRYMGMKYEDDPNKCKRVGMGIALKRRDNAPIVKDIFGGALDILMEERSLTNAQRFVQDMLVQVMQNKIPLEKYVITKQLRDDYITAVPEEIRKHRSKDKPYQLNETKASFNVIKNYATKHDLEMPVSSIAHRTLAERMEERDAGNAPAVGDRLPFIYVSNRKDEKKQGDRIEHLDYVKEKGLKPDVEFYITNQIQNPVAQLFALGIEELEGYIPKKYKEFPDLDEEEATLAILKQKEKDLDSILFMGASYLKKHKRGPMDMFLKR
jgi:DNA polymerase elongation subunit (family B)